MSADDAPLAANLARATDERRRRLAGSLDAVALTRVNTTRSSRAIAERAQRSSAELDPPPVVPAEVDRGGWGRRRPTHDDAILRPVHDTLLPPATPAEPGGRTGGSGNGDGEYRSWLQ